MDEKDLNFIRRNLAQIEANAKLATPGPWGISHSCVIATHDGKTFDVASQPWQSGRVQFGVNPQANGSADMRYVAMVEPKIMLRLVELLRQLLPAKEDSKV